MAIFVASPGCSENSCSVLQMNGIGGLQLAELVLKKDPVYWDKEKRGR